MEIKKISEIDFANGRYAVEQQGNLEGNYSDFLLFLNWTLETNRNQNEEHLKEAINFAFDRFKISLTTQFLKNNMRSNYRNKNRRISYLLEKIGMTTTPINRYFCSVINSKMKLKEIGTDGTATDKTYSVGHSYKRTEKEQFDLLIDKIVLERKEAEIKQHFEELEKEKAGQEKPEEKKWRSWGNEWIIIKQEPTWKEEKISKWLQENKGSCLKFSAEDFCEDFRNDRKKVSGTAVRHKLEGFDNCECRLSGNNIKLSIQ